MVQLRQVILMLFPVTLFIVQVTVQVRLLKV